MDLTLAEAAVLVGVTARTLRARIRRGEIPARQRDGRWIVRRADLPLTDEQRASRSRQMDAVRAAAEGTLHKAGLRSGVARVDDLEAFQIGRALFESPALAASPDAGAHLRVGLIALTEGHYEFDAGLKLDAFRRARAGFSRALAVLLLAPGDAAVTQALDDMERRLLPRIAGLIRWAEKLPAGVRLR